MKKIISSAIAIAMLSSTVAMAETVIAPTPQNETTTYTQNFNDEPRNPAPDDLNWFVFGSGKTQVGYGDYKSAVTHVQNPFSGNETDKAVKVTNVANDKGRGASFTMESNTELDDNDILKISFDAAMENKYSDKSNMQFSVKINGEPKGRPVFKSYSGGWVDSSFGGKAQGNGFVANVSEGAFTHYEVIFNNATKKVTYNSGTQSATSDFPDNLTAITSIDAIGLILEHNSDNASASAYYLDNMSFSVTSVTDEKFEDFDTLQNNTNTKDWNKNQTLPNAKYKFDGEKVENTQTIDLESNRGNVLKCSGSANSGYVAMPLTYTMDDDDVFTFQFDYAEEKHNKDGTLAFRLEDYSLDAKRDMGFTFTKASDPSKTYSTTSSCVFTIAEGMVRIAGNWESQDYNVMSVNEFHTITVVIDNSDEAYPDASGNAQRTLAIYVDGALQSNTKWIMTDNDGKESSNTINGVSLTFNGGWPVETHYFDNLWASLADNDIKVDGDNVSYTYPVVYDDATPAIFVKAYYDANNRLISADASASATPSTERTVTTTLNKPEGTVKTKVFRWDSLNAIQNLSPAYDSSKVN